MAGSWLPRLYLYLPPPPRDDPGHMRTRRNPAHLQTDVVVLCLWEKLPKFSTAAIQVGWGPVVRSRATSTKLCCPSCSSCLLFSWYLLMLFTCCCIAKALSCPGREGTTSTPNKSFFSSFLSFFPFFFFFKGRGVRERKGVLQRQHLRDDSLDVLKASFFCQIGKSVL